MKIREIKHRPLFVIEFSEGVAFTELGDCYEGVFNLEELTALGDHISAALQDHNPPRHHVDKVSDDVDTDPPDEYDDGMDGDHASALASAGWGTDEDYGG